jgi:hypothetical protein
MGELGLTGITFTEAIYPLSPRERVGVRAFGAPVQAGGGWRAMATLTAATQREREQRQLILLSKCYSV